MGHSEVLTLALTAAAGGLFIWGGRRKSVSPVLVLALVVFLLLWIVLPLALQATFAVAEPTSPGPWSRGSLGLLQSALLLAFALVLLAFRRPYLFPVTRFFDDNAPALSRLTWLTAAVVGVLIAVEFRIQQLVGGSFLDSTTFALRASGGDLAQVGVLEVILHLTLGYCVALVSIDDAGGREGSIEKRARMLAWLGVLIFAAFAISRGMRAVVLLPVIVAIIALGTLHGRARRRALIGIGFAGTITIFVGAPAATILGILRQQSVSASSDLVVNVYSAALQSLSLKDQLQLLATELNRKFDEVGPGVELLALEPPGSGGVAPILSASVSPVPRLLYPKKPVPTSRDGTNLGVPFRIAATAYGDPEGGMVVPVSSTAIALWEFGAVGPLVMLLLNIIWFAVLNTCLLSRNVLFRGVGMSVIGFPTFQGFVLPPSQLVQICLRLVALLVLLFLATLFWKNLRQAKRPQTAAVVLSNL